PAPRPRTPRPTSTLVGISSIRPRWTPKLPAAGVARSSSAWPDSATTGWGEPEMVRVERLRADHAPAVLAFELENPEDFSRSIPDRGDAYFAEFAALHRARLAEQDAGECHFHVVFDDDGALVGRVNLVDVEDGIAELGYRVAERAAGRGVATAAVAQVCQLA